MEPDGAADAWFDRELSDCRFVDERLGKRLRQLVQRMEGATGASIPLACQDWANTKAAYRVACVKLCKLVLAADVVGPVGNAQRCPRGAQAASLSCSFLCSRRSSMFR